MAMDGTEPVGLVHYLVFGLLALVGLIALVLAYRGSELDSYEAAQRKLAQRRLRQVVRSSSDGLIAFITGANSGIGLELAETLARCGVKVALGCRSRQRGTKALVRVKTCAEEGGAPPPILILIDVSSPGSVASAAKEIERRLPRVDLLYLNAGIMPTSHVRTLTFFEALGNGNLGYFLETGRSSRDSPHTLPQPLEAHDRAPTTGGAPFLFSTHVLGHLFLTEQLLASGVLKRGRVPVVDSSGIDKSDRDREQPTRRDVLAQGGGDWAFNGLTREGEGLWLDDRELAGGGGARVIWTSSRAASKHFRNWDAISVQVPQVGAASSESSATAGAGDGGHRAPAPPRHCESYGEAKYVVDMLNVELDRRLREQSDAREQGGESQRRGAGSSPPSSSSSSSTSTMRSMVMCPGFVATELTPWFMKVAVLIEPVIRPYLSGFNVKLARGADALVRLGVLSAARVRGDVKWVSHRGKLAAALGGDFPREQAEVAMAAKVCDEWMARWRQAASSAAPVSLGKQAEAGSNGTLDAAAGQANGGSVESGAAAGAGASSGKGDAAKGRRRQTARGRQAEAE